MKLPGRLHLIILLLIALSSPLPSQAGADDDRSFTAEPALRKTILTGFIRARATMKLTSRLTEKIVDIKGDPGGRIGKEPDLKISGNRFSSLLSPSFLTKRIQ